MSLPPATKLSLAVRKNIRDEFEAKKDKLEERLSKALGVPWTVEANPLATFPYATDGYPLENHGGMLYQYFDNNITTLDWSKDNIKEAVNKLVPTHILTVEVVPDLADSYASTAIADGKLVIQINSKSLGVNLDQAVTSVKLEAALNDASKGAGDAIPFAAEESLSRFYKRQPGYLAELEEILGKPVKLNPRLAENAAAFKAESARPGNKVDKWEETFGGAIDSYFSSFLFRLRGEKFKGDEMLQEGFFEAVDKAEIALRIVDKLTRFSYCETVIEDGVMYLQTTFDNWFVNTEEVGRNLVDLL